MPAIKTVVFDDDVMAAIKKFQEYMDQDNRVPMSFSRAVNFIVNLQLETMNIENGKGGKTKIE